MIWDAVMVLRRMRFLPNYCVFRRDSVSSNFSQANVSFRLYVLVQSASLSPN
jgi:hypothetical protein